MEIRGNPQKKYFFRSKIHVRCFVAPPEKELFGFLGINARFYHFAQSQTNSLMHYSCSLEVKFMRTVLGWYQDPVFSLYLRLPLSLSILPFSLWTYSLLSKSNTSVLMPVAGIEAGYVARINNTPVCGSVCVSVCVWFDYIDIWGAALDALKHTLLSLSNTHTHTHTHTHTCSNKMQHNPSINHESLSALWCDVIIINMEFSATDLSSRWTPNILALEIKSFTMWGREYFIAQYCKSVFAGCSSGWN